MGDDQQDEGPQTQYGSRLAQMFGYVTSEDRSRWEQQYAQNKSRPSVASKAAKSAAGSMMEFGERNVSSKLDAAHKVAGQQRFDETHEKITSKRPLAGTTSIVETVDYEPKEDRDEIEPDLEL